MLKTIPLLLETVQTYSQTSKAIAWSLNLEKLKKMIEIFKKPEKNDFEKKNC